MLPLIQGEPKLPKEDSLPRFAKLKKVLVKYAAAKPQNRKEITRFG